MILSHEQLKRTESMHRQSNELIKRADELIRSARQQIKHVRDLQAAWRAESSPPRMI
jgi:hypothetical protein